MPSSKLPILPFESFEIDGEKNSMFFQKPRKMRQPLVNDTRPLGVFAKPQQKTTHFTNQPVNAIKNSGEKSKKMPKKSTGAIALSRYHVIILAEMG